jgi:hypothetical protein
LPLVVVAGRPVIDEDEDFSVVALEAGLDDVAGFVGNRRSGTSSPRG